MDDLELQVLGAIKEIADCDDCTLDSNLKDLGVDSMCLIELVMEFELEHDVSLPTNNLPNLKTVRDIADEVRRALA